MSSSPSPQLEGGEEEENCWGSGRAIIDDFSRAYPDRAEDLDMHAVNFARIARYINGPVKTPYWLSSMEIRERPKRPSTKNSLPASTETTRNRLWRTKTVTSEGVNTNQALLIDLHRNLSQLLDYDTVTDKSKSVNARVYYGSKQGF